MSTQVSEMTMVDYFKGVHSTGMDRIFVEAEQRRQEYDERVSASGPIAAKVPMSFEETIAAISAANTKPRMPAGNKFITVG